VGGVSQFRVVREKDPLRETRKARSRASERALFAHWHVTYSGYPSQ
jgi:hypothetical protein